MSNVKTIYPPTKFVKENVLSAQLRSEERRVGKECRL